MIYGDQTNYVAEMYERRHAGVGGVACCESCAENMRLAQGSACMSCGRPHIVAGVGGDTSVPDPIHPSCIITFHCDNKGQHCTSTSSCGNTLQSARMLAGAGGDLIDIAAHGYKCGSDAAPVGTGDLVDAVEGTPMPGDSCSSCGPTLQHLIDAAGVAKPVWSATAPGPQGPSYPVAVPQPQPPPQPPPPPAIPVIPGEWTSNAGPPSGPINLAGLPAGLGVTAAQIDGDLVQANTLAKAHSYATDDFTDAVIACDTAITDCIAADNGLTANPSASIIGTQSGIVTKLLADRKASSSRCTTGDYETAYTAATTAYQAYLKDAALPANVTPSPTPAPAPQPAPPIVVLPTVPSPTPGPTLPPATTDSSYATPVLVGAAVIGVALVGYAAYKRYVAGGRGKTTLSRAKTRIPSGRTAHSARTVRA